MRACPCYPYSTAKLLGKDQNYFRKSLVDTDRMPCPSLGGAFLAFTSQTKQSTFALDFRKFWFH